MKIVFSKNSSLSGSGIYPSDVPHVTASAFWADADIYVPDCFQKFRYRQIGIVCFEALASLYCKDQLQVSGLIPVIQE